MYTMNYCDRADVWLPPAESTAEDPDHEFSTFEFDEYACCFLEEDRTVTHLRVTCGGCGRTGTSPLVHPTCDAFHADRADGDLWRQGPCPALPYCPSGALIARLLFERRRYRRLRLATAVALRLDAGSIQAAWEACETGYAMGRWWSHHDRRVACERSPNLIFVRPIRDAGAFGWTIEGTDRDVADAIRRKLPRAPTGIMEELTGGDA